MWKVVNNKEFRNKILACNGNLNDWPKQQSDMLYIPQKDAANFVMVMKEFVQHQLILELAIPTYIKCFSTVPYTSLGLCEQDWVTEPINLKPIRVEIVLRRCNWTAKYVIHPIKYITATGHQEIMERFIDFF